MLKNVLKRSLAMLMAALMLISAIPDIAWAAQITSGSGTWISGKLTYTYVVESQGSSDNGAAGSVSVSGSTMSVRAVSSKAVSGCNSVNAYATTTTVTVNNASNYPLTINSLSSSGVTVSGVQQGGTVAPGASFTVSITADPNSAEDTSSRTASGTVTISVAEKTSVTITAVASPYVSYTLNGRTVQQGGSNVSFTASVGSTISLPSITAPEGYQFKGWRIGGKPVSMASSFTVDNDCEVYPVILSGNIDDGPNYKVGSTTYTFWEEAMTAATSSNNKKVIVNQANVTLPASLEDNILPSGGGTYVKPAADGGVEYIIPSGVTLLVPFDEAGTSYTNTPAVVYGSHTNPTAFHTLTMETGTSITVQSGAALSLGGKLSSSGQMGGWNGTPTGPDGRIHMKGGSRIALESGANLYCWGYIYGDGEVEAKSGSTVYEAFQIKDWRGGTATSNIYKYAFIFNQYYIQNIEVPLTVHAGASEKLYSSVNASSAAYPISATLIGSGGMFGISSGFIVKDYRESTDRLHIEVDGNATVSSMTISGIPMIGSISTSDYILPISSNITIDLRSGTSTITQDVEFLPGTEVIVGQNASLQIPSGKKAYFYDNDDWANFSGTTRMYPIGYSVANGTTAVRSAAGLKDALLDVNGTVTVAGTIYTSNGGANITSSQGTDGGNGRIVFSSSPTASATVYEMLNNSEKTAVSFTAPKLHNGDDTHSATTGTGAGTWYYDKDGEHWYRYLVNFVYNGKTIGKGYYCENNATVAYDASWLTGLGASVTSGSATASVSGGTVNVTNVTSDATVTLTGTAAQFVPTFVLNEKQYQIYRDFTGNTLNETRVIDGQTWYVVKKADVAMTVGAEYAAPADAQMGVTDDNHNGIVWNLSGVSASSGNPYAGFVPVGESAGGEAYIYGFYTGSVAFSSFTGQYYSTLAAAMADLPAAGTGTVRLIADCGTYEEENGSEAFPTSADLTVDLNGHKALGRLINKGSMTLDLNGGTWDYHTGAAAAAAAYRGVAAIVNTGTLTVQDSAGGGLITTDAINDNSSLTNYVSLIRNEAGGELCVTGGTLETTQDVNAYSCVILNYTGDISSIQGSTLRSLRGYAIWNYGGHIGVLSDSSLLSANGINNRNVRGGNTIAAGYNIAAYGTIDKIENSTISVGQYAIYNGGVISEIRNSDLTAHPDSAQVNTIGSASTNASGNVQCYTVFNSNAWWYDTAVWKRTDSGLTRTDEYKEDESCRPTIGTIIDCHIYAENTSTSADHGVALYNVGIIETIGGNSEIKTYKHPDNARSIASNYALRNTGGGIIHHITGSVDISATGYSGVYNDGQFTARIVNTYGDKIGGVQLHNVNTYGAPSVIDTIDTTGTISAGSYYAIYTNGKIGSISGATISANYNVLLNSGAGAVSSYEFVRTYTSNTDSATETKREETYVRNLTDGGVIGSIDGVHFIGAGNNSYYLLQNQGRIDSLRNSVFTAASPRAGEGYAMVLNGDGRQAGHTLTREPYAYEDLFITPYEYHYDYDVATIGVIDNVTVTKKATFAFRNLGVIDELKNSAFDGSQYVLVNAAAGPYVSRDCVRYYSGATKFASTKNNGSELTYAYERNPAEIRTLENNTIAGTSTYTLYNGGRLGTLTGNTIGSTNTTVLYNGGASVRSFTSNVVDIIAEVTATSSACTVVYGNEARINTTDYDAPIIGRIGSGNEISGTYQVLVNQGEITAIDGGETPVVINASTQKQVGGIYNYAGTLDRRVATTPYVDGVAGSTTNSDTYLNAHIGSIRNAVITTNGIGIQNGSSNATYLPVIDELGEGLEVNANCTTAGYHAVYNTAYAKIADITGGVFTAKTAATNAYRNNNMNSEHATLISGGDFKGAASTRDNAIFEPDNANRQTYPAGKTLVGTRSASLHNGETGEDYYFIGVTFTVTFDSTGGSAVEEQKVAEGQKAVKPEDPTKENYAFAGWYTDEALTTEYDFDVPVTADLTLYARWEDKPVSHDWGEPTYEWSEDCGTVTAKRVCKDDATHVETETVSTIATVTKAATCEARGETTYTATFENAAFASQTKVVDNIPVLGHQWEFVQFTWTGNDDEGYTAVTADYRCKRDSTHVETLYADLSTVSIDATCTEAGTVTFTAAVTAENSLDGTAHAESKTVTGAPRGHDWGEPEWTWNGTNSATAFFTCGNDASHTQTVNATISDEVVVKPTCTETGKRVYTASAALDGRTYTDTKEETIAALGHDWSEWAVTNEPTCETAGAERRTCSRCGEVEIREIEALGHDMVKTEGKAATCTEGGNTEYYTCSRCGKFFADAEGKTEIAENSWVIEALGHDYEAVVTEPTCTEQGYTTHTCSRCGDSYVDTYVDALGHDWSEWTVTTEPACEKTGAEKRTCSRCGEVETREVAALGHDMVKTEGKAATCTETGNTEYYTCSRCGKFFADAEGKTEIAENSWVIEALGHDWGEPVWSWTGTGSATAAFACKNDEAHTQTVNATITSDTTDPTCETAGRTVYTATVIFEGKTYTDTKEETVAALGHDWGVPSYEWTATDNGWEVTATAACGNDETHVITETVRAVIDETQTVSPGCETAGYQVYTATFEKEQFTPQTKRVEVPALGHIYEDAVTAPTCTEQGYTTHVCSRCGDSYVDSYVDALGHDWGEPAWNWTEDNTATATFTCGNDAAHTDTVTAVITSETAADGTVTYTATVEFNDRTYTDTKTVAPSGHRIIAKNYTKGDGKAETSIEADRLYSGEVTFTVTAGQACLVAVKNADGSYTTLKCTDADGAHTFTVTVTDADVTIVVVYKGDANLDGNVNTKDATLVKQFYLSLATPGVDEGLQTMVADCNGDGMVNTKDATLIKQAYLGLSAMRW